jgi:hypothetical protein
MTKQKALQLTTKRFTNLLDGSVVPSASVGTIISFYEALCANTRPTYVSMGNIEREFLEESIREFEEEENLNP